MPLYAFYPQISADSTTLFETDELDTDDAAMVRARAVLADHPDAGSVAVWQALRFVCHIERSDESVETSRSSLSRGRAFGRAGRSESADL